MSINKLNGDVANLKHFGDNSFQLCADIYKATCMLVLSGLWSSQNYVGDFWAFEFPIFNDFSCKFDFSSNSPLYPMEKPQLPGKRAIVE